MKDNKVMYVNIKYVLMGNTGLNLLKRQQIAGRLALVKTKIFTKRKGDHLPTAAAR